jgi:hypothetical protein
MPNRKTFDERERYDHSGRPLNHREANDLKADVQEDGASDRGASSNGDAGPQRDASPKPTRDPGAARDKARGV